ncbi:MAG: type II toxin-antitoxin system death-on-curing family toxin [Lactobacillaceae bacterium]|jgi:death-on-curing protein|nr:type II toxin-antitoxin system death-on-curing family toxin [Lactobacillaceae bacterium]
MRYLTKQDLVEINSRVIKNANEGTAGVQYPQGLDLVIQQPQQVVFGQELYPNVWIKAAYLMQKITKKHVFVDGNKRTALMSAIVFLRLNGHALDFGDDETEQLVLYVTTQPDTEEVMIELAEWLKGHEAK